MKKPIGTDNVVMDAVGIKVMIPKPKSGEIDELIEMRTCLGVGKRRHGWFTKSGRFEVEGIVCVRCGAEQAGWEEVRTRGDHSAA